MNRLVTAVGLLVALLGCRSESPQIDPAPPAVVDIEIPNTPWFEDVANAWGIDFMQQPGPTDDFFMPQVNGTGVAMFDFDRDGKLDLYFLQGGDDKAQAKNQLYRQVQTGKFENVSEGSGLDIVGRCTGVAVGDVDNDGWTDVLVNRYGGINLLRNRQNGTFEDITRPAGLANPLWGTSASFFDFDRDGWLDLFVANYVDYDPSRPCTNPQGVTEYCGPRVFSGTASKLFHNLGKQSPAEAEEPGDVQPHAVRFADVTVTAGIASLVGPALGVLTADFTGDGWQDIFVANDEHPNRLWVNQHNGTFADESVFRGLAYNHLGDAEANMGIAYNDVDRDGLLDVFVTHLDLETHTLWRQHPRGLYQDQTQQRGISRTEMRGTGFGTIMEDFDHDGDVDAAVANGHIQRKEAKTLAELGPHWSVYAAPNHLFMNNGDGGFHNISASTPALCDVPNVARGLACGDLDGDGALDLVVTRIAQKPLVLRNLVGKEGSWLRVRATDPQLKRDAYGAEVTVHAGDQRFIRRIQSDGSFQCASEPIAHFGLNKLHSIESIVVVWPDGMTETFPPVESNRVVELEKGSGIMMPVIEPEPKAKP